MCTLSGNKRECGIFCKSDISCKEQEAPSEKARACGKCGQEDARISIRGRNVYCEKCFVAGSMHKFKATLGKHKAIRRGDSILVGHSGKANSTVLLHLIKAGMEDSTSKKLIFQPRVLYIDDGAIKGRTVEERRSILRAIYEESRSLGLMTCTIPLSWCLSENHLVDAPLPIDTSNIEAAIATDSAQDENAALQGLFHELEDDTARDELLRKLRRQLLLSAARRLNCDKVLLADTSMELAVKVLADISTGRGARLSADVAFLDNRCSDVTFLRPMRDFTRDEVTFYMEQFALTPILRSRWNRGIGFPCSVRSVSEGFVGDLDSAFHGTVATIYRTSEKLLMETMTGGAVQRSCALCDVSFPADCSNLELELSAVQATNFSKSVSSRTNCKACVNVQEASGKQPRAADGYTEGLDPQPLAITSDRCASEHCVSVTSHLDSYLCYGCRTIFRCSKLSSSNGGGGGGGISSSSSSSSSSTSTVSSFLFRAIQRSLSLKRMRTNIADFLL